MSTTVALARLTTLRLGGPARRLVEAASQEELIDAVAQADAEREPLLLVAGGSNLVIADEGFDGTAVRIATRGVSRQGTRLQVQAGEPWDAVVARAVDEGLAGIECLSGIPGSTGATPIQNVGAYGQDVSQTIAAVRVYDRRQRAVRDLSPAACGFGYRTSALKGTARYLVLSVEFALEPSERAGSIAYEQLRAALAGRDPALPEVRAAVLALRRAKGMVLDPDDPDSVSAGSFFLNPIIPADVLEAVAARAGARPPAWPEPEGRVKTSAAWLIERAGYHRGYGNGRVGVSSKHTLALINRGGASTTELIALARELRDGVREAFGVTLQVEPTLVGVDL